MTVVLNLDTPGTFNGIVSTIEFLTGGDDGAQIEFTFNRLAAVPEPSSFILLGMGLILAITWKRLRSLASAHHG